MLFENFVVKAPTLSIRWDGAIEKDARRYGEGLDESVMNAEPGTRTTCFLAAPSLIILYVSFISLTLSQRNIPPVGSDQSQYSIKGTYFKIYSSLAVFSQCQLVKIYGH